MVKEKKFLGCFGSDNYSGVCPEAMDAILKANVGYARPYGEDPYAPDQEDPYTAEAKGLFRKEFGKDIAVYFVLTGTAANVISLSAVTRPFHSIIAAETAHLHTMETGAIYAHTGCKMLLIPSPDGKIFPDQIVETMRAEKYIGHHATLPKVVSISQSTELGTIYTPKEIQAISAVCKKNQLLLHVDGCRLYNAAAELNLPLRAFGKEVGVDIMSLGGTKNGLMSAEAILFFDPNLAEHFPYTQKQRLHLISKMRFLSAQYIPFLKDGVWKKNAEHANRMASRIANELKKIPGITFYQKRESNQIFLHQIPKEVIKKLQDDFILYIWDEAKGIVRIVTSFNTKEKEVDLFIEKIKRLYK